MYNQGNIRLHVDLFIKYVSNNIYSNNNHGQPQSYTVTPFKFAAIKVRGFEIMTYSRPFNFVVSYQNYFTVSYTNVVFSYTN